MEFPRLERIGHVDPPRAKPDPVRRLPSRINDFVVLPDDDTVVAACENDGPLSLVSLRDGALSTLPGHDMPVNSLTLADGGRLLVSASDDATLRVWDLAERRVVTVLRGHEGFIRDIAAAGTIAVSGGEDATVRVWDLSTGEQTAVFDAHERSVDHVAVSPGGTRAVSVSRDNRVLLWDLKNGIMERTLYETDQRVFDLDVPFEGSAVFLLMGTNDSGVGHANAPSALWFADEDTLYSAAETLIGWDLRDGRELSRSPAQTHELSALARHPRLPLLFAPSLQHLGVFTLDGERRYALGGGYPPEAVVRFLDDGRLVSSDSENLLKVWPPLTGAETDGLRHAGDVRAVAVDPTGRFALSVGDSEAMLWNLDTGDRITVIPGADTHRAEHTEMFTPDGEHFVVDVDGRARRYPTTGAPHTELDTIDDAEAYTRTAALLPVGPDRTFAVIETPHADEPRDCWHPMLCGPQGDRLSRLSGETSDVAAFRGIATDGVDRVVTTGVLDRHHPLLDNPTGATVSGFGVPALQCWNLSTGELAWTRHTDPTLGLTRTSPGYQWIQVTPGGVLTHFGLGDDAELRLLDLDTGEVRRRVQLPDPGILDRGPRRLSDHSALFIGHAAEELTLWTFDLVACEFDAPTTVSTTGIGGRGFAHPLPQHDLLLLLGTDALHCVRLSTGERVSRYDLATEPSCATVTPDGRTAIVGDDDGAVHILRVG